jgi:putative phage-type endonuclease
MCEEEKPISLRDKLIFYKNNMLPQFTESRLEFNRAQVRRIEKMPQPVQRSPEWYEMRNSMLSASDWGTILGMNKYGGNKNQVLLKKCCDDIPFFTNAAMQWGIKYEAVAIQIYEKRNQTTVIEFGCIRHPVHHFLGASPDGITADGVMVEIKCPSSRVIDGIIPDGYYCQVQGQLEVCELDRCDFLECRILEYTDEDDYLTDCDNTGNFYNNQYGSEKGVVANFIDTIDNKSYYEYSPIGLIGSELVQWKSQIMAKYRNQNRYLFEKFTYWYLERVSCIPIYRNQEWFNKALIELRDFWGKVCYYRNVGVDKLKEDIQKEKDDKVIQKQKDKEAKEVEKKSSTTFKARKITTSLTPLGVGSSRESTEFIETNHPLSDSDEEYQKHHKNVDVYDVFSDEVVDEKDRKSVKLPPVIKKSENKNVNIFNVFTDDEPKEEVVQKKNVLKKIVEKKSVVKKEKKTTPSSSFNILSIFTDEEVQDMKK